MPKIRINKLALELDIQNDQIIDELKKKDIPVKNHMSSIDEEAAEHIRELFSPEPKIKPKAKAKAKAPAKSATKAKAKTAAKATTKAAPKSTAKSKKNDCRRQQKPRFG